MKFLYTHYIQLQLNACPREDYAFHFSLTENALAPSVRTSYEKTLEFTAVHAFLLGLHTGRGLSEY